MTTEPGFNRALVDRVQAWRRAADEPTGAARCTSAPANPDEARQLSIAADRAPIVLPGPVGELVRREIRTYLDLGFRFGDDAALVRRLAREVLAATPGDQGCRRTARPDRQNRDMSAAGGRMSRSGRSCVTGFRGRPSRRTIR